MINETGTFYLEGEYQQGDTILSAGDWELRADGSKNVFAYTPDTFVRRNLLNWSEDFANSYWTKSGSVIQSNIAQAPDGSLTADKLIANDQKSGGFNLIYSPSNPRSLIRHQGLCVKTSGERYLGITNIGTWTTNPSLCAIFDTQEGVFTHHAYVFNEGYTAENIGDGWWLIKLSSSRDIPGYGEFRLGVSVDGTVSGLSNYIGNGIDGFYLWGAFYNYNVPVSTPYQRTTTHVPRPFAIKDELVTNGTFDTNIDGWANPIPSRGSLSWESGRLRITTSGSGSLPLARQNVTLRANTKYLFSVNGEIGTSTSWFARLVNNANGTTIHELSSTINETKEFIVDTGSVTSFRVDLYYNGPNTSGLFVEFDNVSLTEVQMPVTLGNASHKDFRYYPKALSANEVEALKA